jgi:hypothetical protein
MLPDEKVRRAHDALVHVVAAEQSQQSSGYTHPIDTQVPPSGPGDRTTPRAQTRQDFDEENKRRSRASVNLAGESVM